jgi:hypothetical protein
MHDGGTDTCDAHTHHITFDLGAMLAAVRRPYEAAPVM